MGMATFENSALDLFSQEVMADPYPYFAELRERGSVIWLEKLEVWAITRYEPIRAVLGDWAAFSSKGVAFNDAMNQALANTSLAADPPGHQMLRSALSDNLSPRALRRYKAMIDAKADALVAELVERGSFEAMDDLARALPLSVVVDLIGVKGEARKNILAWGEAAFDCLGPMNERAGQAFKVAGEFFGWASQVTAADLEEGSMGHGIFAAAERGEFPPERCGDIIHQYIAAGMDTTIASIGNMVALFGAHPDQFDLVRADRSRVPSAFNEVMRYSAPVHAFCRVATKDIEIDGTPIPAGGKVTLLFGSGNHDPRHYEDPDRFLIERNAADHLSFGYGLHGCVGQGLARLQAHAVIDALARRARRIEIGTPERRATNMTLTFERLPVTAIEPA